MDLSSFNAFIPPYHCRGLFPVVTAMIESRCCIPSFTVHHCQGPSIFLSLHFSYYSSGCVLCVRPGYFYLYKYKFVIV